MSVYIWAVDAALKHHCDVCAVPLSNPNRLKNCIGTHVEICWKYHPQFFRCGRAHECRPCKNEEETHETRIRSLVELLLKIEDHCDPEAKVRRVMEEKGAKSEGRELPENWLESDETLCELEPGEQGIGIGGMAMERSITPSGGHAITLVGLQARIRYMKEVAQLPSAERGPTSAELDNAMVQAYMLSNGHSKEKKAAEILLTRSIPNFHDGAGQVVEKILRDKFKEPAVIKRIAAKKIQKLLTAIAAHLKVTFETEREIRKRRVGYFRYITASAEHKMTESRANRNLATGARNLDSDDEEEGDAVAGASIDDGPSTPSDLSGASKRTSTPMAKHGFGRNRDNRRGGTPIQKLSAKSIPKSNTKIDAGYRRDSGASVIASGGATTKINNLRRLRLSDLTPDDLQPTKRPSASAIVADMFAEDTEEEDLSPESLCTSSTMSRATSQSIDEIDDTIAGAEVDSIDISKLCVKSEDDLPCVVATTQDSMSNDEAKPLAAVKPLMALRITVPDQQDEAGWQKVKRSNGKRAKPVYRRLPI